MKVAPGDGHEFVDDTKVRLKSYGKLAARRYFFAIIAIRLNTGRLYEA